MQKMQRRKFTQLVLSGLAVGLGACASPEANQSSAPSTKTDVAQPQKAEPAKAAATPQTRPTQPAVAISAPTAESVAAVLIQPTTPPEPLPEGPLAPFIQSDTWINAAQPISWDSLRGTVTMVEFWTFG